MSVYASAFNSFVSRINIVSPSRNQCVGFHYYSFSCPILAIFTHLIKTNNLPFIAYFLRKRGTFIILLCLVLVQFTVLCKPAEEWTLRRQKDGIRTYTAEVQGSRILAVKLVCTATGTFNQLLAVLFDVPNVRTWAFNSRSSVLLKQISSSEMIFYAEVNTPFPLSNRDYISHLKVFSVSHDTLVIESAAMPGYIPEKEDLVRIHESKAHWLVTRNGDNSIRIEYIIHFNPGGNVPAWMINAFITSGPYETFVKLKERMLAPEYADVKFDYIK